MHPPSNYYKIHRTSGDIGARSTTCSEEAYEIQRKTSSRSPPQEGGARIPHPNPRKFLFQSPTSSRHPPKLGGYCETILIFQKSLPLEYERRFLFKNITRFEIFLILTPARVHSHLILPPLRKVAKKANVQCLALILQQHTVFSLIICL